MKKYRITYEIQRIEPYDIWFSSNSVIVKADSKQEAIKKFKEKYSYPIVLIEEGK